MPFDNFNCNLSVITMGRGVGSLQLPFSTSGFEPTPPQKKKKKQQQQQQKPSAVFQVY